MGFITSGVHLSNDNPNRTLWAHGDRGGKQGCPPGDKPSGNMKSLERFANVKISRSSEVIEFTNLNPNALSEVFSFLFGKRKKNTPKSGSVNPENRGIEGGFCQDERATLPFWDGRQ